MSSTSGTPFELQLAQALAVAGLSQRRLAQRLQISKTTVNNWVTGTTLPNLADVYRLADELDLDARDLIGTPTAASAGSQQSAASTGRAGDRAVAAGARRSLKRADRVAGDLMSVLAEAQRQVEQLR